MVDFSIEREPRVFAELNATSVPALANSPCLGVALYDNNTKLVATAQFGNLLRIIDLGANPRSRNWNIIHSSPHIQPKRVKLFEFSFYHARNTFI